MTLKEIITNSAIFTDERFSDADLLSIANKAISLINNVVSTKFPFYTGVNDTYDYFPKTWQYSLISPYMSYGIKMNDSSLSEADRYLEEFYKMLNQFKDKLQSMITNYENGDLEGGISPEYIETVGFGGVYGIDTSGAINLGFFGNNGNGGCY